MLMTQFALLLLLPLLARTISYPSSFRRPFGWMPDGVAEHVIDDWDAEN